MPIIVRSRFYQSAISITGRDVDGDGRGGGREDGPAAAAEKAIAPGRPWRRRSAKASPRPRRSSSCAPCSPCSPRPPASRPYADRTGPKVRACVQLVGNYAFISVGLPRHIHLSGNVIATGLSVCLAGCLIKYLYPLSGGRKPAKSLINFRTTGRPAARQCWMTSSSSGNEHAWLERTVYVDRTVPSHVLNEMSSTYLS